MLYNIPNVTTIPYVFFLREQLLQQEIITYDESTQAYRLITPQGELPIYIETANGTRIMSENDFLLLSASDYFTDVRSGNTPPPVSPDNPIPNNLVLDGPITSPPTGESELAQATAVVQEYNNIIASAASNHDYTLVDIHTTFQQILDEDGRGVNEDIMRPVPRELFSFDGVHPSNYGHGIVANLTIETINNTYNANLPSIELSSIPRGLPINN